METRGKLISMKKLQKAYAVVDELKNLIAYYEKQNCEIDSRPKLGTDQDFKLICTGVILEKISSKILITKTLHQIFIQNYITAKVAEKDSKSYFAINDVVPTINEVQEKVQEIVGLTFDDLRLLLKEIAYDFKLHCDGSNTFSYLAIADAFLVSDKTLSNYCLNQGTSTKKTYTKGQYEEVLMLYNQGMPAKEIEKKTGVIRTTIYKWISKIIREENQLNSLYYTDIDHNTVIERIGSAALKKGYEVYSEHNPYFKADIGPGFRYIDLVLMKNSRICCAIEIEKSKGLEKSIHNLRYHYKDAKLKILFVTEKNLPKARVIRERTQSVGEFKIIKLHENLENTVMKLLSGL